MGRTLLAFALLAGAQRLSAQVSLSVADFGTLRAGETARIEWRGLPEEVEELELLLFVEGRQEPIRVTPQLAAGAGLLMWRVPNLPSRRARLTIRFGLDGEEVEAETSAPVEILPAENEPPAAVVFHDGECWAQARGSSPLSERLGAAPGRERLEAERESPSCSVTTVPSAIGLRRSPRTTQPGSAQAATAAAQSSPSRKPLEVPARI